MAATVLNSGYEVETNLEGNIETFNASSGPIATSQTMEFNNNHSGPIRAAATHMTQTDNHAGAGTFSFSAGDISPSTERPANWPTPNNLTGPFGGADGNVIPVDQSFGTVSKVQAGSHATFTVTFDLGVGETKQANLWLNYTIEITNGNQNEATVEWTLTAPDMSTIGISSIDNRLVEDSDPNIDETVNTGEMSTILDQAGTYTLSISADIPYQDFNNYQHSASATLDAVYFEVVNIPEPSSTTLLGLALGASLLRRRR